MKTHSEFPDRSSVQIDSLTQSCLDENQPEMPYDHKKASSANATPDGDQRMDQRFQHRGRRVRPTSSYVKAQPTVAKIEKSPMRPWSAKRTLENQWIKSNGSNGSQKANFRKVKLSRTTLRSSPSKTSTKFLKAAILVNPMVSKAYGIDEQIKARMEKRKKDDFYSKQMITMEQEIKERDKMFDKMYKASVRNVNKVLAQEPTIPGFITSPKRHRTPNRRL